MSSRLPEPYERALRGDLRALRTIDIDGRDGRARGTGPSWALAARSLRWLAQPDAMDADAAPSLEEIGRVGGDGAWESLSHLARAAFLTFDRAALDAAYTCARSLLPTATRDARVAGALWTQVLDGWCAVMDGAGARAASDGAEVARAAQSAGLFVLTVEGATLSAFGRTLTGDIDDAIAIARRASRMAQTEHLWLSHYFVSALLARLRRLSGRPHLGGLVASACLAVTPPAFTGWLLWERLFSGASDPDCEALTVANPAPVDSRRPSAFSATVANPAPVDSRRPSAFSVTRSEQAWRAASRLVAQRATPADVEALLGAVTPSAMHARDAHDLLCALDPGRPTHPDSTIARWLTGSSHATPPSLCGLTAPAWADTSPDAAPVAAGWPGGRAGRRLLGFAVGTAYTRLSPHGARAARPEAIAAAVTLAGDDGIALPELFAAVYNFAFRRDLHEPTFKVERHRAKKLLEPAADLISDDGRLTLRARQPFVVTDPRCQRALPDALLRHLAAPGGATARELAERLDVPLRSVQQALQDLTADGACTSARDGRRVAYTIEDTTFCELTVS